MRSWHRSPRSETRRCRAASDVVSVSTGRDRVAGSAWRGSGVREVHTAIAASSGTISRRGLDMVVSPFLVVAGRVGSRRDPVRDAGEALSREVRRA